MDRDGGLHFEKRRLTAWHRFHEFGTKLFHGYPYPERKRMILNVDACWNPSLSVMPHG